MPGRWSAVAAILVLALCSAASTAHAQSPFVGQWRWNKAESSEMPPGEAAPNDVVLVITAADPARVQWSLTAVDAKGDAQVQSFSGTGNGTAAPIAGSPDGAVAAYTVTPTAVQAVHTSRDGSVERTSCAVSPDGRKLTCHGTESDGRGNTRGFQDVYDRR
jgi:hypothetical protein